MFFDSNKSFQLSMAELMAIIERSIVFNLGATPISNAQRAKEVMVMKKAMMCAVCLLVVALVVPAMADDRIVTFKQLEDFVAIHGGKVEYADELPVSCRPWVRKYTVGNKSAHFGPNIAAFNADGIYNPANHDTSACEKGTVLYPVHHLVYTEYEPRTVREFMALGMYPIRKDGAELIEDGTAVRLKVFPLVGWAVPPGYQVIADDGEVYPAYHRFNSINQGAVIKNLKGKIPTDGEAPIPNPDPQPQPGPDPQPQPEPDPQPQPGPLLPDPKPLPKDSGGGGCQSGAYGWLLAPVALWLRKRQR